MYVSDVESGNIHQELHGVVPMSFQGKEFTQGMKQLVINLKEFNDIERRENDYKAVWAIEQTAKGLGIGQATVRRIMAEYNKNKQSVPDNEPKTRGKPEYAIPQNLQPVVRQHIRSQNLKGLHVSVDLVRKHLAQSPDGHPKYPTCGHFKIPHLR